MRVGIFQGTLEESGGGGYTFQTTLANAFHNVPTDHEFIIFHTGQLEHAPDASPPMIDIHTYGARKKRFSVTSALKKLVVRANSPRLTKAALVFYNMLVKIRWFLKTGTMKVPHDLTLEKIIDHFGIDVFWFLIPTNKIVSVPFICTVWDLQHRVQPYFPEMDPHGWSWDAREKHYSTVLPRAYKILTGTEAGKTEIMRYYGVHPDRVDVVPLPVPGLSSNVDGSQTIDVREKYGLKNEFVFYPAQFWPHKNHANALHALRILKNEFSVSLDMVFTGSDKGNEVYIRKLTNDLGMADRVHFLGFVPRDDLFGFYKNALALVFPTFFGPDNLPPLEAFQLGCPVVASSVEGAKEQLGEAALFFDPKEPRELARELQKLYNDPSLKTDLINRGYAQLNGRTPEDYIATVSRILDDFVPIRRCWDDMSQ